MCALQESAPPVSYIVPCPEPLANEDADVTVCLVSTNVAASCFCLHRHGYLYCPAILLLHNFSSTICVGQQSPTWTRPCRQRDTAVRVDVFDQSCQQAVSINTAEASKQCLVVAIAALTLRLVWPGIHQGVHCIALQSKLIRRRTSLKSLRDSEGSPGSLSG